MKRLAATVVACCLLEIAFLGCSNEKTEPADAPKTPGKAEPAKAFGWRGDGTGVFSEAVPPEKWSEEDKVNILWKPKVGSSYSSPVLGAGRVFLTAEQDDLVCVDAKTGEVVWKKTCDFKMLEGIEENRYPSDAGYATATPVTDGKHVWMSFGTGIVVCFDVDGNRRWIKYFDRMPATEYGRAASPVLAGGKLIVSLGGLIALDAATGEIAWEAKEALPGYGTPALARIDGKDVVVTPTGFVVNVADGKIVAKDIALVPFNSPVVHGDVFYFVGATATAVKAPEMKRLWEEELEGEFYASPVYHDGLLYAVSNEGKLYVLDAKSGETVYEKQVPIPSASAMIPANIYASLAVAGGKVFISNDAGSTLVLKPGRTYEEIATNTLDEGSGACPIFDGSRVYHRGGELLYCIGKP